MKKIILLVVFQVAAICYSQSHPGLIVGDAVRIRSSASVKGKEISKVYGQRKVEIIQESDKWDDLGKKDEMCSKHKWVKVKWDGDSTGWVYGQFIYEIDPHENAQKPFMFNQQTYQVVSVKNYNYPPMDEEGLTACTWWYRIYIKDAQGNYSPVYDVKSKENFNIMTLESSDGAVESITSVNVDHNKIIITVEIGYQEGGATAVYTITRNDEKFSVSDYSITFSK